MVNAVGLRLQRTTTSSKEENSEKRFANLSLAWPSPHHPRPTQAWHHEDRARNLVGIRAWYKTFVPASRIHRFPEKPNDPERPMA